MTITPDTKDWTWVLQRPCPECGFDARLINPKDIAGMVRRNASEWATILAGPDVRTRPSPDIWSPLEYGCHVRDVYRVFDGRLQRMLTEESPMFENWDQNVAAVEGRYGEQDPTTVSRELQDAATQFADRLDTVSDFTWFRAGRRSDGARFLVSLLARYCLHDAVHHVYDVTGNRFAM